MKLSEFVDNNEVLYTKNLIGEEDIAGIQEDLGVSLGEELTLYILKYGFLAFKYIELYGINSRNYFRNNFRKELFIEKLENEINSLIEV